MKKSIFFTLSFAFIIIMGCSNTNVKTQPISGSYAPETKIDLHSTNPPADISAAPLTKDISALEELFNKFYTTKATKDAVEIDIENLEMKLRTGKIEQAEFDSQISQLRQEEKNLDLQETDFKNEITALGWDYENPDFDGKQTKLSNDTTKLLTLLEKYETLEEDYEIQEDTLEADYQLGKLTKTEFISKKAQLEMELDRIDEKQDQIEHVLDALGIDD